MADKQPPTNDDIREYVEQILRGANLERLTMKRVCKEVCRHFPGFDLAHRNDYIKATIMSVINSEPNMAQVEKLIEFLEENPEIAKGTGQAENADDKLQTVEKWDAIAIDLNSIGGQIKSGESWAEFWGLLKNYINRIITERKTAGWSRRIVQLYPLAMIKRIIMLLEGPRNEEALADLPPNDEITAYVEQILLSVDLEKMWRETVYNHVCSHYPGLDLVQQKDFVKATIKSTITSRPSIAQMEKLVKFLEENPDIATGTGQAEDNHEGLQATHKWDAIANELNMMEGRSRCSDSWEDFWELLRTHLNQIIAGRRSATGSRGGVLLQLYSRTQMEQMINLLGGPANEDITPGPSDAEIKEFVEQILHGADLEKITRQTVYKQVFRQFPGIDLAHKKDFIKAKIIAAVNSQPSIAQMEKLVQFLVENPDIVLGTGRVNNAHESLQTTQKWEALANELNLMEGEKRTGDSWAEFWDLLRTHLNQIIADRNSLPGFHGGSLHQYPRAMMEHLIILLGGPGNLDIPAAPSNDEIKKYVKRVCIDLDRIWRRTLYKQVVSHYSDYDIEQKKDFIKTTIKSVTRAHIISKHAIKMEDIYTGNVLQFGEGPSTSRQEASAARLARRAAEHNLRTRAQAMRRPAAPPTAAERLFNIDEGRLQVNLKSAEALSSYGATAEHIAAFIAACSNRIALEIEHRNTPN